MTKNLYWWFEAVGEFLRLPGDVDVEGEEDSVLLVVLEHGRGFHDVPFVDGPDVDGRILHFLASQILQKRFERAER